jgi:hypothetical protein
MRLYRWFKRRRELGRLHRYFDMCMLFHYRGKMTDREFQLHADWVCEQKDKLRS